MSVIDSLSAGFRFLGRRVELLVIPVVLDLLLWVVPRLSAAPLFEQLAGFYVTAAAAPELTPDTAAIYREVAVQLERGGHSLNLFGVLANRALLHVPSLMAILPTGRTTEVTAEIANPAGALISVLLLSLTGMLIGVFYLNMLARGLPLGEGDKSVALSDFFVLTFKHWLWILVFVLGLGLILMILSIPAMVVMLLLAIISPALLSGMAFVGAGLVMALLFYLYFVAVGLILDNLSLPSAVWRSITLVRHNFWPTLGFVLLTNLINVGFSLIWVTILAGMSNPIAILLAVLGNAYIGTGLAMGLLVFYRTRLLRTAQQLRRVS